MAAPKKKSKAKALARKVPTSDVPEPRRRSREQSEEWVKRGRPEGEEPWRATDWDSLSHLPEARDVLRSFTANNIQSLGELKDMLDELGRRVGIMAREDGRNAAFSPIAEVILALSACILAEGAPPAWVRPGPPNAPRMFAKDGIDVAALEPLAKAARVILVSGGDRTAAARAG